MNPATALTRLQRSVEQHGLTDWTVSLDSAVKRFGVCNISKKHISISRKLCELNSAEEVTDTILHEIAHALAFERHGENCGHDSRWKAICREIGARPVACYDNSVVQPDARWVLVHRQTGEVFRSYHKRPGRDWSRVWIRGRKKETFGQLTIRAKSQMNSKSDQHEPTDQQVNQTIKRFNDQSVLDVHQHVTGLLRKFAEQHGLRLSNSKCKYNSHKLDLTLSLEVPLTADVEDEARIEFGALAPLFDLTAKDYHKEFSVNGRRFKLTGFKPNNRKYPIIAADDSGQLYKFETNVLDQLISKES